MQVAESLLYRGRETKLRILCTREIQRTIKDSVHKLLRDLIEKHKYIDYEVLNDSIINKVTGTEFIFKGLRLNVNEIKSTEGIDVAWCEEAQSVTMESLDVLIPTVRKKSSKIIFTFNRFAELDPVYVKFILNEMPKTYSLKINSDVLEKYGLLTEKIKADREYDRINNPSSFSHIWEGEPINQDDNAAISRDEILKAMRREVDDTGQIEVGVDVARMGNDRTTFWKRKGLQVYTPTIYTKMRIPDLADKLEEFVERNKQVPIKIDDTGVGGGLTDEMMRRQYNVIAVNFGSKAINADKYINIISEGWFYLKNLIPQLSLPENSDLLMELSTRRYKVDIRGRWCIESKDDYKKRGYRSPDLADGLILCVLEVEEDVVGYEPFDIGYRDKI